MGTISKKDKVSYFNFQWISENTIVDHIGVTDTWLQLL